MLDLLCRAQSAEQNAQMSTHGEQSASQGKNYQTSLISDILDRGTEMSQKIAAHGEHFAEQSASRATLLSKSFAMCA